MYVIWHSIWTIDLAYLLARYKLPHQLCTITLGANSDYATKVMIDKYFCLVFIFKDS